jgi:hypothetical protein
MAFLKSAEECMQISKRLYKGFLCFPAFLEQLSHTTVGWFRENCENSKAFATGKMKFVNEI